MNLPGPDDGVSHQQTENKIHAERQTPRIALAHDLA
jgi:hypothetical protein